jgi:hypothetical protein
MAEKACHGFASTTQVGLTQALDTGESESMTASSSRYLGSCHCEAIGFSYCTAQKPAQWSVRACQCTFCRAHAALSTSDPAGQIEFHISNSGALNRYRFGQRTTDFLLCRDCGVYIGATMETPSGRFGIINTNALRPLQTALALTTPMNYGSETQEQRVARRERLWSPVVSPGV